MRPAVIAAPPWPRISIRHPSANSGPRRLTTRDIEYTPETATMHYINKAARGAANSSGRNELKRSNCLSGRTQTGESRSVAVAELASPGLCVRCAVICRIGLRRISCSIAACNAKSGLLLGVHLGQHRGLLERIPSGAAISSRGAVPIDRHGNSNRRIPDRLPPNAS